MEVWSAVSSTLRRAAEEDDWIVTRTYDSVGGVLSETQNGRRVDRTYNDMDLTATTTYPNGRVVSRIYDDAQRLAQVHDASGSIASFQANALSIAGAAYGNGAGTQRDHFAPGLPLSIGNVQPGGGMGDALYMYDRDGRLASEMGAVNRVYTCRGQPLHAHRPPMRTPAHIASTSKTPVPLHRTWPRGRGSCGHSTP